MARRARKARESEVEDSRNYRDVVATCIEATKSLPRAERLREFRRCLEAMGAR